MVIFEKPLNRFRLEINFKVEVNQLLFELKAFWVSRKEARQK